MLLRRLKNICSLPRRLKWLLMKAVILSGIVKITLAFFPFKYVLRWLGEANVESSKESHFGSIAIRTEVKTAIQLCNKYVFWKTECYTQAITAKLLLKYYHLSSTVYIGFNKNETGYYEGHAWLRCFDTIITGGVNHEKYQVQSFFC